MVENEIEIDIGGASGIPKTIAPSPTGQLLELGTNVLPVVSESASEALAILASSVSDSEIVPSSESEVGMVSRIASPTSVPGSEVSGGQGVALTSGSAFSRGLVVTNSPAAKSSVVSGVSGEPTLSQIEKVYDATNTCRSNVEIMKITGLALNVVTACVAWLIKKGWIVEDESKKACSIEAMGKMRDKFKRVCDFCNK
jgi:hypothetical protein